MMSEFLFAIFQYAAIPGLFTALTVFRYGWNDVAALMWLGVAVMFFASFGIVYTIAGVFMSLFHVGSWMNDRTNMRRWKSVRKCQGYV